MDFTRTRDAIAKYDREYPVLRERIVEAARSRNEDEIEGVKCSRIIAEADARIEELEVAVGVAFGLDTPHNNPTTCRDLVRPGPPVPAPGSTLSFVRQAVLTWEKRKALGENTDFCRLYVAYAKDHGVEPEEMKEVSLARNLSYPMWLREARRKWSEETGEIPEWADGAWSDRQLEAFEEWLATPGRIPFK